MNDKIENLIAHRLELWRKQKEELDITFDEIAEKSFISRRNVCRLFSGELGTAKLETVYAIESVLGLLPDELEEERELISLISQLTDDECAEISKYIDFIISKRG